MNIAITNVCNLRCPYCFAGDMGEEDKIFMSPENVRAICEWCSEPQNRMEARGISIIGGEPTIHPQFSEILSIVTEFANRNPSWNKFLLFSNGIELEEYIPELMDKMGILLNFNSPHTMSEHQFAKIISTIEALAKAHRLYTNMSLNSYPDIRKATLGVNIYETLDDYSYIWDVVSEYGLTALRVSVSAPCNSAYLENKDEFFKLMKPKFMEFVREAYRRRTFLTLDCSQIPYCYFTAEELILVRECTSNEYFQQLGNCIYNHTLLPDLTLTTCFGDANFEKMKKHYLDYGSIEEAKRELSEMFEKRVQALFLDKCQDCTMNKCHGCHCGCAGFRG